MSYINKSVSINGTEIDFIKAFANELTSADSRITCETDIDAEFANEDTSYKPKIVFNISDTCTLHLERASNLSTTASGYNIFTNVNNINKGNSLLTFASRNTLVTENYTRTYNFIAVSNENNIFLLFGNFSQVIPNAYSFNAYIYLSDSFNAVATSTNVIATKSSFIRTDSDNQNETYTIANCLLFSRGENVEIIERKPLLQSNTAVYDMKNVYDCSNVTANNILLIDNNRFFAVDSNTLIKIKE